ncbi:50S ribosomal protein L9 [Candidatus Neptunochlamydia vexilliferae]|uniref:Large ribosomal subunit protein bL9 n=1 Tax=Candidatus Neptunichlamydia vexilliferae TaxID=1651774 RepID=A0ABS0AWQ9_9BACT|nr:50S ribosomal protein L9 [Candidatus Neptunochlamydia vexilliferae]MBF5058577.1 50S ribosomal protein L9 [Candidatus Neptunochlamydia vexilliferae]
MKQTKSGKTQLLLLEDVTNLGKKGDLASAKPGFVRNFLLPQKKAVIADKRTIRMQEKLQEERSKQAAEDKKESETLAARLKEMTFTTKVKNDTQGHLYGSVGPVEVVKVLADEGITIERKNVVLPKPIKMVGMHDVQLKLKEDVPASFKLTVEGETVVKKEEKPRVEVVEEGEEDKAPETEEATEDLPMRSERDKEMKEELEERTKE